MPASLLVTNSMSYELWRTFGLKARARWMTLAWPLPLSLPRFNWYSTFILKLNAKNFYSLVWVKVKFSRKILKVPT